jgi:hypothetical protein
MTSRPLIAHNVRAPFHSAVLQVHFWRQGITGSYNIEWQKAVRCCSVMGTVEKFMLSASGENSL